MCFLLIILLPLLTLLILFLPMRSVIPFVGVFICLFHYNLCENVSIMFWETTGMVNSRDEQSG